MLWEGSCPSRVVGLAVPKPGQLGPGIELVLDGRTVVARMPEWGSRGRGLEPRRPDYVMKKRRPAPDLGDAVVVPTPVSFVVPTRIRSRSAPGNHAAHTTEPGRMI